MIACDVIDRRTLAEFPVTPSLSVPFWVSPLPHLTKTVPFFSCTYVEPILQPFCFHIHAWNGGVQCTPLYTKKSKELMSTTIWGDLDIPARSSNCENTNGNKCLRRPS